MEDLSAVAQALLAALPAASWSRDLVNMVLAYAPAVPSDFQSLGDFALPGERWGTDVVWDESLSEFSVLAGGCQRGCGTEQSVILRGIRISEPPEEALHCRETHVLPMGDAGWLAMSEAGDWAIITRSQGWKLFSLST